MTFVAPEILGYRRYNEKVDIYSWAMVLWEMLCLQRPYVVNSIEDHRTAICFRGDRPSLPENMPGPLKSILQNSWDANIAKRFSMSQCCQHLENLLSNDVQLSVANIDQSVSLDVATNLSPLSICDEILNMLLGCANNALPNDYEVLEQNINTAPISSRDSPFSSNNAMVDSTSARPCSDTPKQAEDLPEKCSNKKVLQNASNNGKLSGSIATTANDTSKELSQGSQIHSLEARLSSIVIPPTMTASSTEDISATTLDSLLLDEEITLDHRRLDGQIKKWNVPLGQKGTFLYHRYYGNLSSYNNENSGIALDQFLQSMQSTAISQGRERASIR